MSQIKTFLQDLIDQNKLTCSFALDQISQENSTLKLNPETSTVGFIFRHIGETMNLFGFFFGIPPRVPNTTMGKTDEGLVYDLNESRNYYSIGFEMLESLVQNTPESEWSQLINTPFFGTVSKMRLFSHVLYHNAHHAGQIALTLSKGH